MRYPRDDRAVDLSQPIHGWRGRQDERRSNFVCYIQKRLLCFYTEVSHEGRPRGHGPPRVRVRVRLPLAVSFFLLACNRPPPYILPARVSSHLSPIPLFGLESSEASLRGPPSPFVIPLFACESRYFGKIKKKRVLSKLGSRDRERERERERNMQDQDTRGATAGKLEKDALAFSFSYRSPSIYREFCSFLLLLLLLLFFFFFFLPPVANLLRPPLRSEW